MIKIIEKTPIVEIENKILTSLRRSGINNLLDKYKIKLLSDQDPKEKVDSFQEVLNNINYSLLKLPNEPWEINYQYKNSQGTTKILLHNKFNANKSTLVFHHGLGSTSDLHLKGFLSHKFLKHFNVFSIKSSHHENVKDVLRNYVNSFDNILAAVASSVLGVDSVCDFHKNNSVKNICVSGVSLGGIVASLHHFFYDTADYYYPIISYPNFGEVLLDKKNQKVIANYKTISKNKSIKKAFDIPKKLKNKDKKKLVVFLSKKDELIDFNKANKFWRGYDVRSFDSGHHSIFLHFEKIRKIILKNKD